MLSVDTRPRPPTAAITEAKATKARIRIRMWSPMAVRSSLSGCTVSTSAPACSKAASIWRIRTLRSPSVCASVVARIMRTRPSLPVTRSKAAGLT